MPFLKSLRSIFARPRKAPAILVPRTIRAKYDAAQTARDNENHWGNADGLSAAAANSPEVRRTLRNRARYEVANNSYASGMVRTLANDVIGVGPQLQMLSGQDAADKAIETSFWNWMQAVRLPDKLRLMRMARCVDGETFALMVTNQAVDHAVSLDLKVYEAEQIANPFTSLVDEALTDGITVDSLGNPVSYSVLKEHPGDLGLLGVLGDAEDVSAARMLHLFKCERAGQYRGIPELMASLPLYAQLRRYTLAVIAAAETAANISALHGTQAIPEDDVADVAPLDLFDLERNTMMTLPRGWQATQMKAEQPATTYEMFKREIITEIARCLNMPYNVAAGDSSRYNYASGRLDHKTYFKAIRVDRSYIVNAAMERVFAAWWREARLLDLFPGLMEFDAPPPHEWRWDGDEHVDPLKEASAAKTLMSFGGLTFAKYYGRSGDDWEEQQQQGAKELGVSLEEYRALVKDTIFPKKAEPAQAVEDDDE